MSTQSLSLGGQSHGAVARLRAKLFIPSLSDLFFLSVVMWSFFAGENGWSRLLMDASTGFHIRVGDFILGRHQLPAHELFSFTAAGQPWYAFEWLSEVLLSSVHSMWGLKGIVILAGAVLAGTMTVLLRSMLARGVNAWIAVLLTLLVVNGSNVEFHARPHIFTLLLLAIAAWIVDADRRRPGPAIWALVPLTILWTNLHGGFFVIFPFLGLLVAGTAIEALAEPAVRTERLHAAQRYCGVLAACVLGSLINPYGIALHKHILATLGDKWIASFVAEFKSPSFHAETLQAYMVVLFLALGVGGLLLVRRRITEALWIAFFAYCSLMATRHVPLFLIVAAPIVAVELNARWSAWVVNTPRNSAARIIDDLGARFTTAGRHTSIWVPIGAVGLCLIAGVWPKDFPDDLFPSHLAARNAASIRGSRLYTTDQWADYLIYRDPQQKVFMDDQHQAFATDVRDDFMAVDSGAPTWSAILDRYRVETVLASAKSSLTSLLRIKPEWRVVDEDKLAVLFARQTAAIAARE